MVIKKIKQYESLEHFPDCFLKHNCDNIKLNFQTQENKIEYILVEQFWMDRNFLRKSQKNNETCIGLEKVYIPVFSNKIISATVGLPFFLSALLLLSR